ncbi:MAG: metallophosphoesterase [Candidatus Thermoplasmatota archaeon]
MRIPFSMVGLVIVTLCFSIPPNIHDNREEIYLISKFCEKAELELRTQLHYTSLEGIVNCEGDIEEINRITNNSLTTYLEKKFPLIYLSNEIIFEKETLYIRVVGEEDYDFIFEVICSGFFKVKGLEFEKKFYYKEELKGKDLDDYIRLKGIGKDKQKTKQNLKFSFAVITDFHIGGWYPDYGGKGYDDSNTTGQENDITRLARAAVIKVNKLKSKHKIKFVIVPGDLTNKGERSEFEKAKEILDELDVPYIPTIGNHDMWPHTDNDKAPSPIGDQYFKETFDSHFNNLKTIFPNWDDGTRTTPIWNGEADTLAGANKGANSYFQNFAFDYDKYHFIFADFNSRDNAGDSDDGVMPEADLFDSKNVRGSWHWFKEHLKNYPNKGKDNIFIIAHHPLTKHISGSWFSFSPGEYHKITSFLNKYKNSVGYWFAGHYHMTRDYDVKTWWYSSVCKGVETSAPYSAKTDLMPIDINKNNWYKPSKEWLNLSRGWYGVPSTVRIVKIYSDGSVDYNNIYEGFPEEAIESGKLTGDGDSYTYSVDLPYGIHTVGMVGNSSANFDIYLKWGSAPNTTNYDAKSTNQNSAEVLSTEGSGKLYVMIYSSSGEGSWKSNIVYGELVSYKLSSVYLSGKDSSQTFYENASRGREVWLYLSEPEHSDFSLYLRWNSKPEPTKNKYDAKGKSTLPHEIVKSLCRRDDNKTDKLYIMVSSSDTGGKADLLYAEICG